MDSLKNAVLSDSIFGQRLFLNYEGIYSKKRYNLKTQDILDTTTNPQQINRQLN